MKCPHCKRKINIGAILATVKSEAKRKASKENGKKGGRPRKQHPTP